MSIISFKFRIKSGDRMLSRHAVACNQVWNFCVATQREAERRRAGDRRVRYPTAFDLVKLCSGVGAMLGIYSDTVDRICDQFVTSRKQHRRCPRFRASFGPKRSLGWIPFKARSIKVDGDAVVYHKRRLRFWQSRPVESECKSGTFVQDARGRWFVVFFCEVADSPTTERGQVGIDLGLVHLATLSTGDKVENRRHLRTLEQRLAAAQRAHNKPRARAINAKIANARRHYLHEQSTKIVRENHLIVVGNVRSSSLARTRFAKSVLDAGWTTFRHMLRYKARRHGAVFIETDERYSSQACSCCGVIPDSSPKGIDALGMRSWECTGCGTSHDRDVNAARNILRFGLERQPLAGEIAHAANALNQQGSGRTSHDG